MESEREKDREIESERNRKRDRKRKRERKREIYIERECDGIQGREIKKIIKGAYWISSNP